MPKQQRSDITRDEVAKHNTADSCWIIIDSHVYDVTDFAALHPGGEGQILAVAGKDVTEEFYGLHRQEVLHKFGPRYVIGQIAGEKSVIVQQKPGSYSTVPYAEAGYWQIKSNPYFNESHHRFRAAVREWYDINIMPDAPSMDAMGEAPDLEMYQKTGQFGLIACRLGPGAHLKMVPSLPGGIKPDEFDYFHEMIAHEETTRLGIYCFGEGLASGLVIGLPPVLVYGPKWMQEKIVPDLLLGNKRICLAISEPTVGSDVAGLATTAVKSPCGKFYIVNGVKKWITNGTFSDYFTTAVRTGGKGMGGISMLLIPRTEGVSTKVIKTSGTTSAGTAYVIFENVKVPVENLLGKENQGFPIIMANFNHERWSMVVGATRGARLVTEEAFKWANQRMVFGKKLIEQPVIRFKLGSMLAQVEAVQGWLDNVTYQMTKMNYKEQTKYLAGPISLLKYQSTRMTQSVSDNAVQIFGGRAITRTGMGRVIESFQRTNKFGAILGGAEEIMADLGVRMAMKDLPNARL
ncbi:hypothetical protein HK104_005525 [Borealophlyctis nickersoniae]|nr:hypothetical protein HK104_005525 [Borealophlyctis nickersoniae]